MNQIMNDHTHKEDKDYNFIKFLVIDQISNLFEEIKHI
jgi:hypothetical protein